MFFFSPPSNTVENSWRLLWMDIGQSNSFEDDAGITLKTRLEKWEITGRIHLEDYRNDPIWNKS